MLLDVYMRVFLNRSAPDKQARIATLLYGVQSSIMRSCRAVQVNGSSNEIGRTNDRLDSGSITSTVITRAGIWMGGSQADRILPDKMDLGFRWQMRRP